MRISGNEPSSVRDPSPNKVVPKIENAEPKVPKQKAEANGDGVINPQNYNFNQFCTENFDALKTLRINESRP